MEIITYMSLVTPYGNIDTYEKKLNVSVHTNVLSQVILSYKS